jgi:hypothetical protein
MLGKTVKGGTGPAFEPTLPTRPNWVSTLTATNDTVSDPGGPSYITSTYPVADVKPRLSRYGVRSIVIA